MLENQLKKTRLLELSTRTGIFMFILLGLLAAFNNFFTNIFQIQSKFYLISLIYFGTAYYLYTFKQKNELQIHNSYKLLAVEYTFLSIAGMVLAGDLFGLISLNYFASLLHMLISLIFTYLGFILDEHELELD
ncbi:MAG: hypothetical protein OHK0017_11900 [Patescibacteria group bacterium]